MASMMRLNSCIEIQLTEHDFDGRTRQYGNLTRKKPNLRISILFLTMPDGKAHLR